MQGIKAHLAALVARGPEAGASEVSIQHTPTLLGSGGSVEGAMLAFDLQDFRCCPGFVFRFF